MPLLDPLAATSFADPALAADEVSINSNLGLATLALAQQVKSGFVDGIFNAKRQAPIAVAITGGTKTFDATDEAIAALNSALIASLISGVSAAFNSLTTQISAAIDQLNLDIAILGGGGFGSPSSAADITALPAPVAAVDWIPSGATAAITLSAADVGTLINAITARRAALQARRAALQAAIAACSSVAAVIALTTATGW